MLLAFLTHVPPGENVRVCWSGIRGPPPGERRRVGRNSLLRFCVLFHGRLKQRVDAPGWRDYWITASDHAMREADKESSPT
jgi:hypothetical protein